MGQLKSPLRFALFFLTPLCVQAQLASVTVTGLHLHAVGAASASRMFYVGSGPGMYAHISDAETALGTNQPGTIILTAGYTDVITSTLGVGWPNPNGSYPGVVVFMMPGSTIEEDITDGGAGIVIYDGSALECAGSTPTGSEWPDFPLPGHHGRQLGQRLFHGDGRLGDPKALPGFVRTRRHHLHSRQRRSYVRGRIRRNSRTVLDHQ
jgi:hypothetical protein